jgi:acid phosphatase family membrane protein YuiD
MNPSALIKKNTVRCRWGQKSHSVFIYRKMIKVNQAATATGGLPSSFSALKCE